MGQLAGDQVPGIARAGDQAPPLALVNQIDRAPVAYERDRQLGQCLEGALDLERREEPAGIGEEQRASQEPLAPGDVAVAPDATDDLVADPLWNRVALVEAPVVKTQAVEALRGRLGL